MSYHRSASFFTAGLLLIFLMTSCHKEKQTEEEQEEQPVTLGTCMPVAVSGHLTQSNGIYTFKTSGGGKITIDPSLHIKIEHDNYPHFNIEWWGFTEVNGQSRLAAIHENLNGTNIKDRLESHRTILFPDSAKITLIADSPLGAITAISIYDGLETHHINLACNTLEESSTANGLAKLRDDAETDGEAGGFEFTSTGLIFLNYYTEDTPGNKVTDTYQLGEIFLDNPNKVNDYYE